MIERFQIRHQNINQAPGIYKTGMSDAVGISQRILVSFSQEHPAPKQGPK
jgi:hypothetical protein